MRVPLCIPPCRRVFRVAPETVLPFRYIKPSPAVNRTVNALCYTIVPMYAALCRRSHFVPVHTALTPAARRPRTGGLTPAARGFRSLRVPLSARAVERNVGPPTQRANRLRTRSLSRESSSGRSVNRSYDVLFSAGGEKSHRRNARCISAGAMPETRVVCASGCAEDAVRLLRNYIGCPHLLQDERYDGCHLYARRRRVVPGREDVDGPVR